MLLKGQSLTIERPARATGTLVGGGAAAVALALALALFLKASGWPVSFPQFLAYAGVGLLAVVACVFAFWAWGCLSMRYVIGYSGLGIYWGPLRHFIAIDKIEGFKHGRGEQRPRISGVSWWGYHVGRGHVEGLGQALFFSTHRSGEDLVYVRTADTTYALSPRDPGRFIAEAERCRRAAAPGGTSTVHRHPVAAHPIWADRVAQLLALAGVAVNVALWGYVFASYPDLSKQITIQFPPIGDITNLESRDEIFQIPAVATAILAANLLLGLGFQTTERAATYLLLGGALLLQVVFLVAVAVAVANA